jgi:hypothetical protein
MPCKNVCLSCCLSTGCVPRYTVNTASRTANMSTLHSLHISHVILPTCHVILLPILTNTFCTACMPLCYTTCSIHIPICRAILPICLLYCTPYILLSCYMPGNNDYLVESNDLMKLNDDQKYARNNYHLSWNNDYRVGPWIVDCFLRPRHRRRWGAVSGKISEFR